MFIAVVILVVLCVGLFYASYSISAGIYLKSLCSAPADTGSIALTFDDGVDPHITIKVLETLKKHRVKATFFIIGEKAARYPELVKRITEEGHVIGNHSYYHKWYFPMQPTSAIIREMTECDRTLSGICGYGIQFFRPPFGVTNPLVARAVKKMKMVPVGWSLRSLDTVGQPVETVCNRVLRRVKPGDVILLHDNRKDAGLLLDKILNETERRGLKAVTIKELFNI